MTRQERVLLLMTLALVVLGITLVILWGWSTRPAPLDPTPTLEVRP